MVCFIWFFLVAVDAFVLIGLLKAINDEDVSFPVAIGVAVGFSIGMSILFAVLAMAIGPFALLVGPILPIILLGVTVSALFGVEIMRSFLIAFIYVVIHIGIQIGVVLMFSSSAPAEPEPEELEFGRSEMRQPAMQSHVSAPAVDMISNVHCAAS